MEVKNYTYAAFIKKAIPLFLMMLFVNVGWGQIVAWDFTGVGSSNLASYTATTKDANLASTSITRGPGAAWSAGSNGFRTVGFKNDGISTANTDFFQFTVTPIATYKVSLSTIDAKFNGTSSFYASPGVTSQFAYSLDGTTFTLIGSPITTTSLNLTQIDLTGITALQNVPAGTTITFRYYASGRTSTGGWGFSSASTPGTNGLAIGGTVNLDGCSAPTTLSSVYSFTNVTQNAMDVAFTPGDGAGRVVLMNTSNTFTAPTTGANPTANTTYTSDQQVVYNGIGSSFSVSGLEPATTYYYSIYEYCLPDRTYGSGFVGSQSTAVSLNPVLSLSGSLDHGSSCVGVASNSIQYTITNTGGAAATGITFTTGGGDFEVSDISANSIPASSSMTFVVTFTPSIVGAHEAPITVSFSNAPSLVNTFTGTGINTPVAVTTDIAYGATNTEATATGNFVEGCSSVTGYGVEFSTVNGFVGGAGTAVASSNANAGNFTATLSGLQSNTTYYYKAFATDATGIVYGNQHIFTTNAIEDPTATAATLVTQTGFTANWIAVDGASGYELDVYENVESVTQVINETFTWTANSTGGNDDLWSGTIASGNIAAGDLVGWTVTSSNKANNCIKVGSGSSLGSVTTPELNFSGSGVLTFRAGAWNGSSEQTTLKIEISGGGTLNINQVTLVKGAFTDFTVNISNATTLTKITFKGFLASNSRFFLDDVKIMAGTMVITPADGYPDLAVVGTSKVVTGLTPNKEYFYVVRAKDATSTSINSNEIAVKTKPTSITWNGTAWSNTTGPDETIDAIIDGNLTTTGNLTAKSLTINAGKVFTVATGNTLTVANEISNNAGATGLVIESDGVLLQTATTANTAAFATVERNSTSLFRQDYTLWSSPVVGQNLRSFSPLTLFNRFYSYGYTPESQPNGAYVQEIITNDDVNSKIFYTAQGYLIRMQNTNPSLTGYLEGTAEMSFNGVFQGNLNNGNLSIPLTGSVPTVTNGFTLVGNPYPSPININTMFSVNPQITKTLYFWRKKNSVSTSGSGYATYSQIGMASTDPTIDETILTHIKTGQGFFVATNDEAPTPLLFNNAMRESGSTMFFKSAMDTPTEAHRFWLNLADANAVVGQTLVGYATDATQGVDSGIDAVYFNDAPVALTSIINNNEYIIQGRSLPFTTNDIVPLGFKTDVAGSYTISLPNFDGLFADNQDIYLNDKATNTLHNLKSGAYTFTTQPGVFNTRFEVQYNTTLSTNNPILDANTILIGVKNQQININAGAVTMHKIELIDVTGRVIYTKEQVNANTATIDNLAVSNQMLIVRITTSENGVVSQKIIF